LTVIFQRGAFTAETAIMASYSLTAYSFGLLSFMLVKILAPGFYSRQDTKTPVKFGIWCMVANMVFNLILAIPFGYVGLAVATSMSATLNAALLYITLHKQGVFALSRTSVLFIARVVIASAAMGGLIYYRDQGLGFFELSLSAQMVEVGITISLSVILFVTTMVVLGMRPRHFRSGGD
jgi:putative peptidoglycan lipid II flippase